MTGSQASAAESEGDVGVSRRCNQAGGDPVTNYIHLFIESKKDLYGKDTNPDGYLSMCVAENRSMEEMMEAKMRDVLQEMASCSTFPKEELFLYGDFTGLSDLKKAVSTAVNEFLAPQEDASSQVTAEDVISVANGCGPALNMLSFALGDPGHKDCFITTKPLYPVFLFDCGKEAEVRVLPSVATSMENGFEITREALDNGYKACVDEGLNPKALLTVNPGNPSGRVADLEELRLVRNWCGEKGLWWISDEIYGCAVHGDSPRRHISALNMPLLPGDIDPPTVVLWGLSKDLGLSGMRVGFCLGLPRQRSRPSVIALRAGIKECYNQFASVSPLTQWFTARMLSDVVWLKSYFAAYCETLTTCKKIVCDGLAQLGIPFYQPGGSIFIWADFAEFLQSKNGDEDDDAAAALFDRLVDEPYKIFPSPGVSFFGRPGSMRFCYLWMSDPEQACRELIRRLQLFVKAARDAS
ncbi:hypothetical protein FOL47_006254 [Perkinsus chesapeaki]|uniref:Aminotransferase class I/classII large domain-containing protein n=1 Tax=Perkinsus chesapeaki TaxID=330153 RepID=A0A7J6LT70_PERCH|nr:hypothetical protein FOL47_006254 [Perkinsus chesapeaki]